MNNPTEEEKKVNRFMAMIVEAMYWLGWDRREAIEYLKKTLGGKPQ